MSGGGRRAGAGVGEVHVRGTDGEISGSGAGITYEVSKRPRSDLYRDCLPAVNSGRVALLDDRRLLAQFVGLERRTARGGRDSIDHAPGAHDDVGTAACGALVLAAAGPARLQIYSVAVRP